MLATPTQSIPTAANRARLIRVPRAVATLGAWALPVAVFGAILVRRWWQMGEFVTGLDAGTWLAYGRGYFGGVGRSTDGAYPPLVPVLIHLGRLALGPVTAAKLVGIGSLAAIMVAAYLAARHALRPVFAVAAVASAVLASAVTEQLAFGGYPQNYVFAFLVLAAFAAARYLPTGRRPFLIGAGIALVGAALSHHMYFFLACAGVAFVWIVWLTTRPAADAVVRRTASLAAAGALAVACFLPTYLDFRRAGYDPSLNPGNHVLETGFRESIRGAAWLWVPVFVGGAVYLAATVRRRHDAVWQVAATTMLLTLVFFPLTAEPRLTPPLFLGAGLACALALQDLWLLGRRTAWGGLPLAAAAALPLLLLFSPPAAGDATARFAEERQLDRSFLNAAAFVDEHHGDGIVVVHQNRRDWPIGWWFEGLTEARIAVGSYAEGIAFPQERDNARLVDRFFDQELTSAQVADLAAEHGVELLVIRKWEWLGWIPWLDEPDPRVRVVYDDGSFIMFALDPQ